MQKSAVNLRQSLVSRREFLAASAASAAALLSGCAINPVSGRRQLMFVSEAMELDLDKKWACHQFSADYGAVQDNDLNAYVSKVGSDEAALTHRPHVPYSFRVVNSVVVNGYTFPAGSVALARGLMLSINNEAELAAVLGHELGHVNARHAGERMTKNMVGMLIVGGIAAYLEYEKEKYTELAAGLGAIAANMLLCRYSRKDETEADELGMEYMTRAEYNPDGMIGLMDTFRKLHKSRPGIVELLFATHPMSDERYETAVARVDAKYQDARVFPVNTERYMDQTSKLRAMSEVIEKMQEGEEAMTMKKFGEAESCFREALRQAPGDYAGLLMMAKCCLARHEYGEAQRFVEEAKGVYPEEAQAHHVSGMAKMYNRRYHSALGEFTLYEQKLPGNPNTIFFKGLCLDKMGRKRESASEYLRYLKEAPEGEHSQYAKKRLDEWRYLAQPQ